jgi:hypothetical protein
MIRHPEALARVRAEADAMFTSDDGGDIVRLCLANVCLLFAIV